MLRDITIGQYYSTESVIHRLDPRVKIVGTMAYLVGLFLFDSYFGYVIAGIMMLALIRLSNVPIRFILKGIKSVLILILFTVFLNLFLTEGTPVFEWTFISITQEGIRIASFMAVRLILLIMGSSLLTLTTSPNQLTYGLEKLFSPMKKIKVPVEEIALMMSIALRFIPILIEETDKIMKAQQARGASFDEGNIFKRAKALIPVLIPLFISAFRRANELAMAMEARCYACGTKKTKMKPLKYKLRDGIAYAVLLAFLVAEATVDKWLFI